MARNPTLLGDILLGGREPAPQETAAERQDSPGFQRMLEDWARQKPRAISLRELYDVGLDPSRRVDPMAALHLPELLLTELEEVL